MAIVDLHLSFRPRLIDSLVGYSTRKFVADALAGVTVGLIALPLAIAFAIASGLRPEAGIFTSIIGGFLISALGGSRVQIGGPAGAFIVIVYGIVEQYGVANLLLATMLAGLILILMGIFHVGSLIRHIPVTIVIGFTNGIAVLIALSQIKDFLGLPGDAIPAEFFAKIQYLLANARRFDLATLALGAASLAAIILWPTAGGRSRNLVMRVLSHIPASLVAVILGTLAVRLLHLDVATIGTRFGGIPQALPALQWPDFDWQTARLIIRPAVTIALLSSIESLLCARVADGMIGERHDPAQELIAQGVANFVVPLFGGFCATGTIARTVANIRSGAVTPVAGMIHAITLLVIILVAAPLARDIPLTSLAAILLFVAYRMGEWGHFARMRNFTLNYRTIYLTVFLLTVVIDLTAAVEAGLLLSCLFFITRVSSLTHLDSVPTDNKEIRIYRLRGSLFFGSTHKLEELLTMGRSAPKLTVLDMAQLLNLDTTGLEALQAVHSQLVRQGGGLILCGLPAQAASLVARSGFGAELGADNIFASLDQAKTAAEGRLASG